MDILDDLKTIWHTAKTDSLPSSKEMEQLVKKFRSQKLRSKWLVIIASCLLSCLIILILCVINFKLLSTYVGGGLMAISGALFAVNKIRSLKRFYDLDDCSNIDFLAFLEQTRQNQVYYYKKTMVYIISICSVGWVLYLYEAIYQHLFWLTSVYSLCAIYLAIMWFIVRPRSFKRNAEKLVATRQRLESILKQLQ